MAEQANPQAGASQAAPSIEDRMQNFLDGYNREQSEPTNEPETPTEQPAAQAEQPQGQAATDDLTPDDIPGQETEAQPAADAFEIVHNGQSVTLSREETIRHAQQGFDYQRKTEALAEQSKALAAQMQRVQEMEQMQQALAPDLAQVQAVAAQLKQWQNVDWVQLAGDNPLEYPKYRAQYDTLVHAHQVAMAQFQQKAGAIQQHKQVVAAQTVQQQRAKLLEMMPAWSDPAKYEQGAQEVRSYLQKMGVDEQAIAQITDARGVVLAYKAAQYDKLVAAKNQRDKQLKTVPPVTRPGASQGAEQISADKVQKARDRLKRSGSIDDAAALLLSRM